MRHVKLRVMAPYRQGSGDASRFRSELMLGAKLMLAAAYGALIVLLPQNSLMILAAPIAVMLLISLWLLPDRDVFPRTQIESIFSVYLVLMVAWPAYLALNVPGLPWVTPTRATLFLLILLFMYSVATSAALRLHLMAVVRSSKLIWILFCIFEVTQLITIPLSSNIGNSIHKVVNNQIYWTSMLFLGCLLFTRPGRASKVVAYLIFLAVLTSLDGFVEYKLEMPPWANHIPSFLRVDEETLGVALGSQARAADGLYRVRGPFTVSLVFAEYLALCMPFILHYLIAGRTTKVRVVMAFAWLIVTAGILLTNGRLGLIGWFIAHLGYLLFWGLRLWRRNTSSLVAPAVVLGFPALAGIVMVLILTSTTLSNRILGGGPQAASDESRRIQRAMAVPKILHNPIGYGGGQSGNTLGFVSPSGVVTVDMHYITTVLDYGVVGFFAFYGIFVLGAWDAFKDYLATEDHEIELQAPLAVAMIIFLVIRGVLSQETNIPLAFLLVGMILALKSRRQGLANMLPSDAGPQTSGMIGDWSNSSGNSTRLDGDDRHSTGRLIPEVRK